MDKNLLLKAVPKPVRRGNMFPKKYPFPIYRESSDNGTPAGGTTQNWKHFIGHLQEDCVQVSDEDSMSMLYSMGFYGKGTLSGKAPGFCSNKRRDRDSGAEDEEVQESKRKKVDEENFLSIKVSPVTSPQESLVPQPSVSSAEDIRESLQLTFQEAYFLSYGLGCLVVMDSDKPMDLISMWKKFCELSPSQNFPVMYTAYHHFRSKGWIVRSGLSYGADYVLYKDGPPFYHSTYSVIVKAVAEKDLVESEDSGRLPMTWSYLAALNRVNSHVAKGILFAFVVKPVLISDHTLATPICVSRFKVQEMLVKRWVPNASREK